MTVRIPLTKGKVAIIDKEDEEIASKYRWYAKLDRTGNHWYAEASPTISRGVRQRIKLHRLLTGVADGLIVDHVNGDSLDNRRSNLRVCTQSENGRNRQGPQSNSKSGYLGVCWDKSMGQWKTHVRLHGKQYTAGYFDDPMDAAIARDQLAKNLHGDFASLNFPDKRASKKKPAMREVAR